VSPSDDSATRVTQLLHGMRDGEEDAERRLYELLCDQLRELASAKLSRAPARVTMQTTELVNETYLRLAGRAGPGWENRRHFFFVAARAMQDLLVESARRRGSERRGGDRRRLALDDVQLGHPAPDEDLLALSDALAVLEAEDARRAHVVRLRFFAGLSETETAELLEVSTRTVSREWRLARARLALLMSPPDR